MEVEDGCTFVSGLCKFRFSLRFNYGYAIESRAQAVCEVVERQRRLFASGAIFVLAIRAGFLAIPCIAISQIPNERGVGGLTSLACRIYSMLLRSNSPILYRFRENDSTCAPACSFPLHTCRSTHTRAEGFSLPVVRMTIKNHSVMLLSAVTTESQSVEVVNKGFYQSCMRNVRILR